MGVRVVLAEREPIGLALRRLKKRLEREGVLMESRRRGSFVKATSTRRAKKFKKRFRARQATLLAKMAGEQPTASTSSELKAAFWRRTGKP
jgi:ribosomal protein S21